MDSSPNIISVTGIAPVNIAVIKYVGSFRVLKNANGARYWGKRDVRLNLPTNSSISVTLSTDDLSAKTSVAASASFPDDKFWLNGVEQELRNSKHQLCISVLREMRKELECKSSNARKISSWGLRVASENNFPTAAGLASSAAGFAALVFTISKLYELPVSDEELSKVARIGSGSSSRSLMGGYVEWKSGHAMDGADSVAAEIAAVTHWPEMRALILVISAGKKSVPSTGGMQRTVGTSTLFPKRCREVVPERIAKMKEAIKTRNFSLFADLTMKDSNQFHAVCLDSFPPIFYLNDTSRAVISFVHAFNGMFNSPKLAYTFDAGPNAVLYFLADDEKVVLEALGPVILQSPHIARKYELSQTAESPLPLADFLPTLVEGIVNIIYTRVGDGPRIVEESLFKSDELLIPSQI